MKTKANWYAIYTRSRAEKKVLAELQLKDIEAFLPLQKRQHQWKDRKKWVEVPLMPGYCFVHITRYDYDKVLHTPNVVCYVTFEGKAAVIREEQILALKRLVQQNDFEIEISTENFKPGKRVEIMQGPLMGIKGELVRKKGKDRFVIRLEEIGKTLTVEIPASFLSACPEQ